MIEQVGRHATRELDGGEIVYMTKPPGDRWWTIDKYECVKAIDGMVCGFLEITGWNPGEFDSPDDVVSYIKRQIRRGVIPYHKQVEATA